MRDYRIAVAGTGYVGLSIATLLSQHHHVTAVDVIPEKVKMLSRRKSPIQDEYIEKYLAEKPLDLTATPDKLRPLPRRRAPEGLHTRHLLPRLTEKFCQKWFFITPAMTYLCKKIKY